MKFDKFNSWFSLITNIGVLLGILLLVIEINQNTHALEVQSDTANWAQWTSLNQSITGSSDLADVIVRGNNDPTSLSPAEYFRYDQYQANLLNVVEHAFRSAQRAGEYDQLEPAAAVLRSALQSPGGSFYYDNNKQFFQADFVGWADQVRKEK